MKQLLIGLAIVAGLLLLFVGIEGYVQVEDGTVVVVKRLGRYSETVLEPGPNWKIPMLDTAVILSTKIQRVDYSSSNKVNQDRPLEFLRPSIIANDKRSLEVGVDVTVQFFIDKERAYLIFRKQGEDFFEKLNPIFREEIRNSFSAYNAENIADKRSDISTSILTSLELKMKADDLPFVIKSVQLRKFDLPDSVTVNVERVQKASQEEQKLVIDKEQEKLKLDIEKTKLERITAEKGQQASGMKLLEQVHSSVLVFQLMETALAKWDGKLPKVLVTSGSDEENPMSAVISALLMDRVSEDPVSKDLPVVSVVNTETSSSEVSVAREAVTTN